MTNGRPLASFGFECKGMGRKPGGLSSHSPISWFDASKAIWPDFRHRMLRHHSEGIEVACQVFGQVIPVRIDPCEACGGHGGIAKDHFGVHGICAVCKGSKVKADSRVKQVPVRWIGERHMREDFGRVPAAVDWIKAIKPEAWMNRPLRLSRELERAEATT